ncbi:MAG: class I SAM-dependent methyltransferase [Bacteroidota bacterium]|nr:class I SAM-dependent methyltransferase [Bacteroidota bacterium]
MNKVEDLSGKALYDFYKQQSHSDLLLETSYGETETVPLELFLKTPEQFSAIEQFSMDLCKGKILDVGAGSGSQALYLQKKKKDVTVLEISPTLIKLMKERGIINTLNCDIFKYNVKQFDTLLFLMNGIGIAGTVQKLESLLVKLKSILAPGGQILFDSSDVDYLYEDTIYPTDHYYGQIKYRYIYNGNKGKWFNWLYIDQQLMSTIAKKLSMNFQVIYEDDSGQYLGRLTLK